MANDNVNSFVGQYGDAAKRAGQALGVDPALILGQWGLETAWGKKIIPGTNNLGNIKDFSGGGVTAKDNQNGSVDKYRAYESADAGADDFAKLLQNKRYAAALNTGNDAAKYFGGLKAGGYAEDPLYVAKGTKAAEMVRAVMGGGGAPVPKSVADPLAPFQAQYGDLIAEAQSRGYTPQEIAGKLGALGKEAVPAMDMNAVQSSIVKDVNDRLPPEAILKKLSNGPAADLISTAFDRGYSADEIVAKLGGKAVTDMVSAREKVADQGAFKTAWDGAGYELNSLGRGAQQIAAGLAGNDARVQELRQAKAAAEADPEYRATMERGAGVVGAAAPGLAVDVGAAALTGGGSLGATVARRAAVQGITNAAYGALGDTAQDGDRLKNAAVRGAIGTAGSLGADALAAVPGALMKGAGSVARGGQSAEDLAAKIAAYEKAGIPVSAADLSPTLGAVNDAAGRVPFGRALGGAGNGEVQQEALARAITRGFGQDAGTLDSSVIAKAQKDLGSKFDDVFNGVVVKPSKELGEDLAAILKREGDNLPSLQSKKVQDVVAELKASLEKEVPATQLQALRSRIGKQASGLSVDPIEKDALNSVKSAIDRELERAVPADRVGLYKEANNQWRHLQAAENMVRNSNDTGVLTASKIASAIKQGRNRSAFERGEAPYQDVLKMAQGLPKEGAETGLGADDVLKLGVMAAHPASFAAVPLAAGARRLLQSTNPAIRNRLLGVPVEQSGSGNALATALAAQAPKQPTQGVAPQQAALATALEQRADQAAKIAGLTPANPAPQAAAAPVVAPQDQAGALASALAQRQAANQPVFKGQGTGPQGNANWWRSQASRKGLSEEARQRFLAKATELEKGRQ